VGRHALAARPVIGLVAVVIRPVRPPARLAPAVVGSRQPVTRAWPVAGCRRDVELDARARPVVATMAPAVVVTPATAIAPVAAITPVTAITPALAVSAPVTPVVFTLHELDCWILRAIGSCRCRVECSRWRGHGARTQPKTYRRSESKGSDFVFHGYAPWCSPAHPFMAHTIAAGG